MQRGLTISLFVSIALVASACPAPKTATTPPPRGKSYDDYLKSGTKGARKKPANTNAKNALWVHSIDIGQGAATLLEFPCGAVLVDTGGEKNKTFDGVKALISYLDTFFARRTDLRKTIDLLAITHPHIDHTRGLQAVLQAYTIRNVIDNGSHRDDLGGRPQIAMHEWIAKKGQDVGHKDIRAADINPKTGMTDSIIDPIHGCGRSPVDPVITAVWGSESRELDSYGKNPNLHSVALRVEFGKSSVLITGDLEYAGISRLVKHTNPKLLDVDVYLVGHHGSKNATTSYLMKAMSPQVAVVSMSPYERREAWTARRFGHPHQKAVGHLLHQEYGVSGKRAAMDVMIGVKGAWKEEKREVFRKQRLDKAVYATGWDGHVVVKMNANGWIEVETAKKKPAAPPTAKKKPVAATAN